MMKETNSNQILKYQISSTSQCQTSIEVYSGACPIQHLSFRHPVTSQNIYGPKVFLLTKIKPEYSDILYNPDTFPWSLDMSD